MRKLALLLLVAPLALFACGSSRKASSPSALTVVRAAILKTVSAPSLHFTFRNGNSSTPFGDVDNVRHVVRLVSTFGWTEIVSGREAFVSLGHRRWAMAPNWGELHAPSGLPSFLPTSVLRHLSLRSVVEIAPGHFRILTAGSLPPVEVWLTHGYVGQLQYDGTTTSLSSFGEVRLTLPPASEIRS